jgi:uncharacterized protein
MPSNQSSLPARGLRKLSHCVYSYPRLFAIPQLFLLAACVIYTVSNLQFSSSRNDLVGADKQYHQNFLEYTAEFMSDADLVAVVESEDSEKNRQFVERLGTKLEGATNLFTDVFYKGDLSIMGRKALHFLPDDTLAELQQTLREYRPFLSTFAHASNLNSLFRLVNHQFRAARREPVEGESLIQALPALGRIISQAEQSLNRPGTPPSPGLSALFGSGEEAERQQYITFAEGRIYVVTARAAQEEATGEAVEQLRELVRQIQAEVPGVNVGITGEPVLEYDEMQQAQSDSMLASLVALALCAFIFVYGYRETGRPIKATICLVFGLGYTMGYTTLVVGHLNILTVTFLPMLIGLAIDFGIHLITRFEEELRKGVHQKQAIETAMVNTGMGIFTGCLTTAGAFFAMALTDFRGIQEMGVITGGGILICLVPMMTLLPVMLLHGKQNKLDQKGRSGVERRARIEKLWMERPGLVAGITGALCALALTQFSKVFFDYNLLNMQSRELPAVQFEKKLIESASKSVLFGAVIADSAEEAIALEKRLVELPSVASVDSMAPFLLNDPTDKLARIREVRRDVSSIEFAKSDQGPVGVAELNQTLFYTASYLGWAANEAQKEEASREVAQQLHYLRESILHFRQRLATGNPAMTVPRLTAFQRSLFSDIHSTFETLRNQDDQSGLRVEDLPAPLRNRFIGRSGRFLLQVYPKEDIWQREHQRTFIKELRTVDEAATGTPVQLYEYTNLLKESYQRAAWYALGAIGLLVLLHFRSLTVTALALLPVAIGTTWTVGLMGLFGVPFNPANIMTLPLVIGIGVTNGIHILNRFAEERNPSILGKSTGKAVLVSALTTMAGFGSLIPAEHQGISSLGMVMATGVAACVIAALTFLPVLITLLMRCGWKNGPSDDNARSTLGREEPR